MEKTAPDTFIDIEKFISESSIQEIQSASSQFSLKQLTSAVNFLNKQSSGGIEKLNAIVSGITDHHQLEAIGASLHHMQMLGLLMLEAESKSISIDKLSTLLVGLPKEIFPFVLRQALPQQLQILQQMGKSEPMQHQLTILSHSLNGNITDFFNEYGLQEEIIAKIDINDIGFEEMAEMTKRIELLRVAYQLVSELVERGLAIAWHTDRPDLIDKYNTLRSICQKTLSEIGFRGDGGSIRPSGLFMRFGNRILNVFGNPDDPHDVEALQNDDPAIEALAKFSVWYLEDFFEVGLLPDIKSLEQLDLDPNKHSEIERSTYRNDLIQKAKQNLEHLGIKTVGDLKINAIFSKKTLIEFINRTKLKR